MYCTKCGTLAKPESRFCTKCGAQLPASSAGSTEREVDPTRFAAVCEALVPELNTGRQGWFSLIKDMIAKKGEGAASIMNEEFREDIDIGELRVSKPQGFAFNTLNGATAEATVIAWQVEYAVSFAVNDKSYLSHDEIADFIAALADATTDDARWTMAMGSVLGGFFSCVPIDNECLAAVLSHYLLNDPTPSSAVIGTIELLSKDWVRLLLGMTYLGTARSFGDVETAEHIQKMFQSLL